MRTGDDAAYPGRWASSRSDEVPRAVDASRGSACPRGRRRRRAAASARHELDLVEEAAAEQRLQRQGRVAQPAEAVVPVAHPADVLREARRRGGHDAAGVAVGEDAQDEQRPGEASAYGPVVVAGAVHSCRARTRVVSTMASLRAAGGSAGGCGEPRRREGQHVTGRHVELVDVLAVAARAGGGCRAARACRGPRRR